MKNYNMDLSKKVKINTTREIFISSAGGINRIPLEREGAESGRITSIVEYFAGATPQHQSHPLGEEIFVLEGILSDENGDYPAGTYLRNPPGTSQAPYSQKGCRIFVKSNQMDLRDKKQLVIDTNKTSWHPGYRNLEVKPLTENAALVKWPKGARFIDHSHHGGEEIFVLKGEFIDEHGRYPKGTWIRSPHLSTPIH